MLSHTGMYPTECMEKTKPNAQQSKTGRFAEDAKANLLVQLISSFAHDLNNPLTVIVGFSDLLLQDRTLSDQARERLRWIDQQALRAQKIVHTLLAFTQPRKSARTFVQVNEWIEAVLNLREQELSAAKIHVEKKLETSLPPIVADSSGLLQALLLLVFHAEQAIQISGRRGTLSIRTLQGRDAGLAARPTVVVEISHNGIGVSSENLKKIFDPAIAVQEGEGTRSIGLPIAYAIVHGQQGELSVTSRGEAGMQFTLRFPAAEIHSRAAAERQPPLGRRGPKPSDEK